MPAAWIASGPDLRGSWAPARQRSGGAVWGLLLLAIGSWLAPHATAMTFGQNKFRTLACEWHIFTTAHFEVFYYPEEVELAREVCELAEAAYAHDTALLRYRPRERVPLFLYRDQREFQQTNIDPSVIGGDVGGFTEAFKNRVVLPAPIARRELRRVITHELMHAYQFNLLYGEGFRSFWVYKGYLVPLWIMEGSAEYAAQRWDPVDDTIIHDAVRYQRLTPLSQLDGFDHLEDVYLAYKESQLAIRFLAEIYGEGQLALVLKGFSSQLSLPQIFREKLGVSPQDFNRDFMQWLRDRVAQQQAGRTPLDPVLAQPRPLPPRGRLSYQRGPIWSPDGKWLAYVSNQDQVARLYRQRVGASEPPEVLTSTQYENFILRGRPLGFSPDGTRIAYVAQAAGKLHLYLLTVADRKVETVDLDLEDYYSPAWSPDGRTIALVGLRQGHTDLFLWEVAGRRLSALTQDPEAEDAPVWSPDGRRIFYTTEREGFWQLAAVSVDEAPQVRVLTRAGYDHYYPTLAPNDPTLYFIGAEQDHMDFCSWSPGNSLSARLTQFSEGMFQPTFSPDGLSLAFATYRAGNWEAVRSQALSNLDPISWSVFDPGYRAPPLERPGSGPDLEALDAELDSSSETPSPASITPTAVAVTDPLTAPPVPRKPIAELIASLGATTTNAMATPLILDDRLYTFRFTPDLFFLLAGWDSTAGLIGSAWLNGSDFLGDHMVAFQTELLPGYQSRGILTYTNRTTPLDLTFNLTYQRTHNRVMDLESGTLLNEYNDEAVTGGVLASRPLSLFDRVELGLAAGKLRRVYASGTLEQKQLQLKLALLHDDVAYYDFDPSHGWRYGLASLWTAPVLGAEVNYTLLQGEVQWYASLDRISPFLVLATRWMAAATLGPDRPLFLFGGIGLMQDSATLRGFNYGELMGSEVSVLNLDLRWPLFRNLNLAPWPFDFLLFKDLQWVVFLDHGVVTQNFNELGRRDVLSAWGWGVRSHAFLMGKQLVTLRFDMAHRLDRDAPFIYTIGIGQAF